MAAGTTSPRSRIARFFAKTSNAIIAGVATIAAALITVLGVSTHEQRSENSQLKTLIDALTHEVEQLRSERQAREKQISELQKLNAALQRQAAGIPVAITTKTQTGEPTQQSTSSGASTSQTSTTGPETTHPPIVVETRGFRIELLGCLHTGDTVSCYLKITNQERERTYSMYASGSDPTRAIDDGGNQRFAKDVALGNRYGWYASAKMPHGVPLSGWIRFQEIPTYIRTFPFIQISAYTDDGDESFFVEFRDIQLR